MEAVFRPGEAAIQPPASSGPWARITGCPETAERGSEGGRPCAGPSVSMTARCDLKRLVTFPIWLYSGRHWLASKAPRPNDAVGLVQAARLKNPQEERAAWGSCQAGSLTRLTGIAPPVPAWLAAPLDLPWQQAEAHGR